MPGVFHDALGLLEASGDPAHPVVGDGIGTVDADRHAVNARRLEPANRLGRHQRRRRWCDRRIQSPARRIGNQVVDVPHA